MATQSMLGHSVYLRLKDNSAEAKKELIAACKQYLSGHEGTVFFAVGTLADEIAWSVSDRDFDVSLLLVFRDKQAHDTYQESTQHQQFLDKYSVGWESIRVFDSYVEQ